MCITKHGIMRFKQRQNIKNRAEMMRRFKLALTRGTLIPYGSDMPDTVCYRFNGYDYIVSSDNSILITTFRLYQNPESKRSRLARKAAIDELAADAEWFVGRGEECAAC